MERKTRRRAVRRTSFESDYAAFLKEVKGKIRRARSEGLHSVTRSMTQIFQKIGQWIVEYERRPGKSAAARLSEDLINTFGGKLVFSEKNLRQMRRFYQIYKTSPRLLKSLEEIPWSQNLLIMSKAKIQAEREFYIKGMLHEGWTQEELLSQIERRTSRCFAGTKAISLLRGSYASSRN